VLSSPDHVGVVIPYPLNKIIPLFAWAVQLVRGSRTCEQVAWLDSQAVSEPPGEGYAHLALGPLNEADHRPVDIRPLGKLLLRQPTLLPQRA
jgi:hypothetical protein